MPSIRMRRRLLIGSFAGVVLAVGAYLALRTPALPDFPDEDYAAAAALPSTRPVVGTNYTHRAFQDCQGTDLGILDTYGDAGAAELVHDQLRQMRARGIQSLRLIVWHMRDVARQDWGVIPSRGGRLSQPYRRNFVAFLDEVQRFGFTRLTLSFSPQWRNSPLRDDYDERLFEENWDFIRAVRSLALEHGPAEVRLDLLNEGAPSGHLPDARRDRLTSYVGKMWMAYTAAFGNRDVTVSAIAPRDAHDRGDRLGRLIDLIEASGGALPDWFEIHLNYDSAGARHGLRYADSVLTSRGLGQPLTIGETSYDDPAVAAAIGAHVRGSERALDEIVQWYARAGANCQEEPPYSAGAYLRVARELQTSLQERHEPVSSAPNSFAPRASASATRAGSASSWSPGSGRVPELLILRSSGIRQSGLQGSSRKVRHVRRSTSGRAARSRWSTRSARSGPSARSASRQASTCRSQRA